MNISKIQRGYGTSVLSFYATHQYISILKVTPSKRVRYVINTCLKKNVIDTCLKKKTASNIIEAKCLITCTVICS